MPAFKQINMSDWQPSATIETLKRRAQLLADVRHFFVQRQVLEVETPILSHAAPTALYLDSFTTDYVDAGGGEPQSCYLQTSPEFAMKRLLAAGSGDIFQIARVFRNGEQGSMHSPEFTMLEWYRPALSYQQLMQEVDELLQQVAGLPAAQYITYQQAFETYLHINPHTADTAQLRSLALANITGLSADWELSRDDWLEILMSQYIEAKLKDLQQPVIVYDFPASQAQLAKISTNADKQTVAARFEVYAGGLELANGYDECTDASILSARFDQDNAARSIQGKKQMPVDKHLLAATAADFPDCTGVALGLDRLLMLIRQANTVSEVLAFSFSKA